MRRAFGKAIVQLAKKDPSIVLITGDVEQEIAEYKELWPTHYFNFGLCEQSMISAAAGMAAEGLRPVVYSITPFILERPFEQIKIDIDEQNLPVILVGYDSYYTHGPTHKPLNFPRLASCFKNTLWFSPCTEAEAYRAFAEAYCRRLPAIIRLQTLDLPFGW